MSIESRSPSAITPSDLQAISVERFGSSLPGINAANIITFEKQRFSGMFFSGADPQRLTWEPKSTSPCGLTLSEVALPEWNSALASQASVAEALSAAPPFDLSCVVDETWRTAELVPGKVTASSLRTYLEKRGLNQHQLRHGALPRALEVLLKAADLKSPHRQDYKFPLQHKSTLTSRRDVTHYFTEQLGHTSAHCLTERISQALIIQTGTGKPLPRGEVVVEGPVYLDLKSSEVHYETICRRTLPAVLSLYTQNVHRTKDCVEAYAAV
ncbi:MAG TPA: hypothetical protein VFI74_01675 [Candidatus Saccharimonadales bacterium]|nr:hypothetical protein [Candidatus Saccharimonadales bacterium]